MKNYASFSLLIVFALTGCNSKEKVIAKIGTEQISTKMIQERMKEAPPAYQNYLNTEAGKKQFVDLLVRERVVVESARKAGMDKRDEYKKAVNEFEKDQARRAKEYKENLLVDMYIRDLHDKELSSTQQEIDKYYQDHISEYEKPQEVTAQHILLPTKEEAEKVYARVKAGEDFAKLAKEVSKDPISASRGGEIGPFKKGDLVPEFEKAVFPLKVNEVSSIVQTQFGFHIIKKIKEKALPKEDEETSKAEIKKMMEKIKFDEWLEKSKNKFGVKINTEELSKLKTAAPESEPALPMPKPEQPAKK